ncbi:lysM domain receptor-like kinase 4 [Cajanus cajan]|uniref:LRR receptor-like serine/threonine-protein kinase At5g48740 family n=1 Tax=Cajanus cajan TaxID=3821 RepID=A0A151RWN9_CAJCA|nr:lysM domain receptor-like kinase 4 [Cajanus cajan]KYP46973.1 putative LRR receptor-like serine/threonine-protein kinase At5g48740 family [Cajanus cajan]
MNHVAFLFTLTFVLLSLNAKAQQNYSGDSVFSCKNNDTMGPSPSFLYTCNGLNKSCMAFLIFKSKPPFNSIPTISNLTSSNPEELARINDATMLTVFPPGKEVIVPVTCSCLTRDYYQAETKYVLGPLPTYYTVALETFQGLVTCDSLKRANPYGVLDLKPGMELYAPLRCACPTWNQTRSGTKYLLTYSVNLGDDISSIATRFNVAAGSVVDANGFSTQTQVIFPLTTVLIPLPSEPLSSMTTVVSDPPTVSPLPVCSSKKCKSKRKLYIAIATTGGSMLVLCVVLYGVYLFRKRSPSFIEKGKEGKKTKQLTSEDIRGEIAIIEHHSEVYKFKEIKKATENFCSKNRIKGSVFRGVFGNGRNTLAVKIMRGDGSKEVNLLKRINHFNLIKLQGYCENDGCHYLVYEYMENGSLREWLRENRSTENQCLANRIQIALDIANGLQYLHNFTEPCYVHRNINSGNILLNKDLRAKIANFALAEESDRKITSGYTSPHVAMSSRYIAPEYLEAGIVTTKMDVYAFGVVLLELITGKDYVTLQDGREVMLHAIKVNLIGEENGEEKVSLFIDPSLTGNSEKACVLQLVKLGLACLIQEPKERPHMVEVVSSLLKIYTGYMDQIIPPSIDNSVDLEW